MRSLLPLTMLVIMSFFLVSCGEEKTAEYLIWHPNRLLKDVAQCESAKNSNPKRAVYCKMVLATTSSFMAVATQQQLSPEAFGLKVLKKQMEFATLKQAMIKEKLTLSSLEANKKTRSLKDKTPKNLADIESKYKLVQHEIDMMLAAIGLIPPE